MKTIAYLNWAAVCLSALTLNAAPCACADRPAAANGHDKTYSGTVSAVSANDHILKVRGLFLTKSFDLGGKCSYSFLNDGSGTINGLRPGEKVIVSYRNVDGTRVADVVEQRPMIFEGAVTEIDAQKHTMSVSHMGLEKAFQIAPGCPIGLPNDRTGALTDVQIGNRVTVTYETPANDTVAKRIMENNQVFTGQLTAIDLNDHTAKASDVLARRNFKLAPNCVVVVNGMRGATLSDVKLGQRLEFDYIEKNGANVVNRIATAPETESRMTASSGSPHEFPTPVAPSDY